MGSVGRAKKKKKNLTHEYNYTPRIGGRSGIKLFIIAHICDNRGPHTLSDGYKSKYRLPPIREGRATPN